MEIDRIEIAKLELEEGDILVVRLGEYSSREQMDHIRFLMEGAINRAEIYGVQVIVSFKNIEMEIIRGKHGQEIHPAHD